jgi:MFS family permease
MTPSSPTPTTVEGSEDSPPATLAEGAYFALIVLFSMNLLNYVDRYVFAGVGPEMMKDLSFSKENFGFLGSSFIIVYTIVAPIVGVLGDRYDRRKILAFGVALWSFATVGTAFARSFNQMFLARAILGIGEASYGVIAPTLLADYFSAKRRGRVMGIFYLALPVGTAIGYGVAGLMEKITGGWTAAFLVVGPPGLLLALGGLMIREPGRGASDGQLRVEKNPPKAADYVQLLRTPSYLLNTMGMAAVTFTTGAFGIWIISYFEYVHGTKSSDKIYLGLALALAGLVGVGIGMWLPEKLRKLTKRAYLLWAGSAVLLAVPIGTMGLLATHSLTLSLGLLIVASVLMSSCLGPCNTVTANVVPGPKRAVGYALSIFLLHLLGDIPSPILIGNIADRLGLEGAGKTPLGSFFESIGAVPVSDGLGMTNITAGMLIIVPVLLIGSLCFFLGAITLPRDQARAASSGEDAAGAFIH